MIGTVMMSNNSSSNNGNATQQPQQQQQQQQQLQSATTSSIIKQSYTRSNYADAANIISDTDMSERGGGGGGTIRSHRSARIRSHTQQQHHSNGSVISFDQASIATTTTITNSQSNNRHPHHNRQHHSSSSRQHRSSNSRDRHHTSQRSVNFNNNENLKTVSAIVQQQQQDVQDDVDLNQNNNNNDEMIQVQILPQDDNWGENTTAYTGATSEVSCDFNDDNMTEDGRSHKFNMYNNNAQHQNREKFNLKTFCSRYFGYILAILILIITYLTPIMFIILPRLNLTFTSLATTTSQSSASVWQIQECGIECEGLLIGISFKLFLLLLGVWALYLRKPKAALPRIYELRALILFLLFILTFSYWLFYSVRILDMKQQDYYKILQFTVTYVDVLLFIYIISVFLIEIRQLQPQYVVKIMRSPDGVRKEYTIGKMSIQRAAVWLLEQYYKDFPVFNPWLENAHKRRINIDAALKSINETGDNKSTNSKYYNVDVGSNGAAAGNEVTTKENIKNSNKAKQLALALNSRTHNDRFYEEYEYERRLRKRKARLQTATEDAFTHIKRINVSNVNGSVQQQTIMDPFEAAQAIFTSIARDLRRYLRITRQQPFFTRDNIISHLADCVSYDISPRAFLERYFTNDSIIFNQRALINNGAIMPPPPPPPQVTSGNSTKIKLKTPEQSWILICDTVLYQNVEDNLMLVLKQNEITLMCTFKRLPFFNLIEDILDMKRNKFVLKMNSETSV